MPLVTSDPTTQRRDLIGAAATAAGLLAYSNGLALWAQRRGISTDGTFRTVNPFVALIILAFAAFRPGDLAEMGFRRAGLGRSLVDGLGVGLGLSAVPLLLLHRPLLLDTPLKYGPVTRFTRRELLVDVLVRVPIGIALFEELAFRGLLYASLRRHLSARAAIAASSATFAGWHLVVTATSAAETNLNDVARLPRLLRPYVQPIAVLGGLLSTGLAGVAFGMLRERSGNMAGCIVAHWVVDGLIIATLWWRRPQTAEPITTAAISDA